MTHRLFLIFSLDSLWIWICLNFNPSGIMISYNKIERNCFSIIHYASHCRTFWILEFMFLISYIGNTQNMVGFNFIWSWMWLLCGNSNLNHFVSALSMKQETELRCYWLKWYRTFPCFILINFPVISFAGRVIFHFLSCVLLISI